MDDVDEPLSAFRSCMRSWLPCMLAEAEPVVEPLAVAPVLPLVPVDDPVVLPGVPR